jgi:integrase
MVAARSYFAYNDIEILPTKFKNKVSLPRIYIEDEQAIDANDIKEILHHCDNRRLKAYLLVLASGAMRAVEALAIRECDLDFSRINFNDPNDRSEPASVRIRKEFAKTGRERNIFISNEAARYLKQWIDYIYRDRTLERKGYINRVRHKEDLIFCRIPLYDDDKTNRITVTANPAGLYRRLLIEFQKVLERSNLSSRKSDGVIKRRKVTFHSFRRFVKTTISNQTGNSDYSEFILGHTKSSYYTNKPEELRRIYKEDCMKYLTFLDYPTVEAVGTSYEAKLKEKDREIASLNYRISQLSQSVEEYKSIKPRFDELVEMYNQLKPILNETRDIKKRFLAGEFDNQDD